MTAEHIPPKKSFNTCTWTVPSDQTHLYSNPNKEVIGKQKQGGITFYRLCENCNNDTGRWYGGAYKEWAIQAAEILFIGLPDGSTTLNFRIQPLEVIKQIAGFFLTINPPQFGEQFPDLRKFVLNKEERGVPDAIRFYCYLNASQRYRFNVIAGVGNIKHSEVRFISEFNHFPFGYQMYFRSTPDHQAVFDITDFAREQPRKLRTFGLNLAHQHVYTPLPSDFRTREEVLASRGLEYGTNLTTQEEESIKASSNAMMRAAKVLKKFGIEQNLAISGNLPLLAAVEKESRND